MEGRGLWLKGLGDQRLGMMVVLLAEISASGIRDLLVGRPPCRSERSNGLL